MKVWTLMIQRNLMIPGIEWKGNEWTLIIQKSVVIPASPMVLFSFKSQLYSLFPRMNSIHCGYDPILLSEVTSR